MEPGPTGKFPNGKLQIDDQGELAIKLSCNDELIFMEFGALVSWIALRPDDVTALVKLLLMYRDRVLKENDKN